MNLRLVIAVLTLLLFTAGCAGGGSSRVRYNVGLGYGSYYGGGPWGGYPVYIDSGPDYPDDSWAEQLPAYGMPDVGSMDMGGFDY